MLTLAKQRQCKGGVDSCYQASVKGRLALDLETSVELEGEEPLTLT